MPDRAQQPEWIAVWHGRHAYLVRFADAEGRRHDWHVQFDNFDGTGRRRHMAWHAWPDVPDPDRWDKPVFLHRRLADAQEEFWIRIVHGWQSCFGYAEHDSARPIYGRPGERRERRFILAELTGRGVCPRCPKTPHLRTDGTLNAHRPPRSLDRCPGTHGAPAVETPLCGHCGEFGGHPGLLVCPSWEHAYMQRLGSSAGLIAGVTNA